MIVVVTSVLSIGSNAKALFMRARKKFLRVRLQSRWCLCLPLVYLKIVLT